MNTTDSQQANNQPEKIDADSLQQENTPGKERLATELQRLAREIQPEAQFQANLEEHLIQAAQSRSQTAPKRPSPAWRSFVWYGLAAVLLLALVWGIRNLLPANEPGAGGATTERVAALAIRASATQTQLSQSIAIITPQTIDVTEATAEIIPNPATLTPTPPTGTYISPYFPDGGLTMQTELPSAPNEVTIYHQLPYPELTVENARQVANQLGVEGEIYTTQANVPGEKFYTVTDGAARVDFMNTPDRFYYTANPFGYASSKDLPPLDNQIANAENFLKDHGLLDEPYEVETDPAHPGSIYFIKDLDGLPLRMDLNSPRQYELRIGSAGEVLSVMANRLKFEAARSFPIITAQEAFAKLVSNRLEPGVEQSERRTSPFQFLSWRPIYVDGQRVELFGNLELLAAVEPGKPPFVAMNGYALKGDIDGLIQTNKRNILFQVWGIIQRGAKGQQELLVEGWQVSPLPVEVQTGTVWRENGKAYLKTAKQRYVLDNLPAGIPEGQELNVSGVVFTDPEPTIHWSNIANNAGGGGGGGGSGFRELNLDGSPTPIPTPTELPPYRAGDQFIGFEGSLFVISYEQPDHSLRNEVTINIEATDGWPNGLYARLEGPGLAGIETFNHKPVRIWGTFGDPYAQPPVWQVERYEPVDPGAVYQGWLGTIEQVIVDGQSVTRFTTQEGQIYILGDSIDNEPDARMGNPEDLLVVEGLIIPGDAFGGLPVLRQTTINLASNLPEPGAYLEQVKKPMIVPANRSGTVSIDKVELVYSTPDQEYIAQPITGVPLFAQPVWRFTGRSDSGLFVELRIQAISPEYLK